MKKHLAIAALSLISVAALAQTAEPTNLDEAAAIELIKGKTLSTENTRWGRVQLQFNANGMLYGSASAGSDSGKWRLEGSKLCLEWRRWDYEGCGQLQKQGDKIQHLWPSGALHFTVNP